MRNLIIFIPTVASLLVGLLLASFVFFFPFSYIDNFNSYLYCQNGQRYQAGSNFVYSIDGTIDRSNDIKARKLCEHGIILDYQDTYTTSKEINYQYKPGHQMSNLIDWVIPVVSLFAILIVLLKKIRNHFTLLFAALFAGIAVFAVFFQKPASVLYCARKSHLITDDLRRAGNKAGRLLHEVDQTYLEQQRTKLFEKCTM